MNKNKLQQLIDMLNKNNIDIAILFRPQELMMTLGYFPHWNASFLVVSNKKVNLYIPDFDPTIKLRKNADLVNVIVYPWATAKTNPWDNLVKTIKNDFSFAKSFTYNSSLVMPATSSNPGEGPIYPLGFLTNLFSSFSYICIDSEISSLHIVKDDIDLEGLRFAHKIADVGVREFFKVKEGMTDLTLSSNIEHAIMQEACKYNVEYVKAYALINTGEETLESFRYAKTGTRTIGKHDNVFLELAVCVNGYWLDLTRVTVVEPSEVQQQCFDFCLQAVDAALSKVKAGIKACELYDTAWNSFDSNKVSQYFLHGLGHSTGFGYHDPGLALIKSQNTVLAENTVTTIEPGIYDKSLEGGMRIEENVIVTQTGYEILSTRQTKLRGNYE